jgi:hypothetical protein
MKILDTLPEKIAFFEAFPGVKVSLSDPRQSLV